MGRGRAGPTGDEPFRVVWVDEPSFDLPAPLASTIARLSSPSESVRVRPSPSVLIPLGFPGRNAGTDYSMQEPQDCSIYEPQNYSMQEPQNYLMQEPQDYSVQEH